MKISVTQEDIDKGCRSDNGTCPIARAASRFLGRHVNTDGFSIYDDEEPGVNLLALPRVATDFVIAFDAGEPVQPFEFELQEIPA